MGDDVDDTSTTIGGPIRVGNRREPEPEPEPTPELVPEPEPGPESEPEEDARARNLADDDGDEMSVASTLESSVNPDLDRAFRIYLRQRNGVDYQAHSCRITQDN